MVVVYKLWQEYLPHFPKTSRYTLGAKIDELLIEISELLCEASYLSKGQKIPYIQRASTKLDMLKIFLQIAWEIGALSNHKLISLLEPIHEIGKMVGGWRKQVEKENPAERGAR